jgi:hypothetical protein
MNIFYIHYDRGAKSHGREPRQRQRQRSAKAKAKASRFPDFPRRPAASRESDLKVKFKHHKFSFSYSENFS